MLPCSLNSHIGTRKLPALGARVSLFEGTAIVTIAICMISAVFFFVSHATYLLTRCILISVNSFDYSVTLLLKACLHVCHDAGQWLISFCSMLWSEALRWLLKTFWAVCSDARKCYVFLFVVVFILLEAAHTLIVSFAVGGTLPWTKNVFEWSDWHFKKVNQ